MSSLVVRSLKSLAILAAALVALLVLLAAGVWWWAGTDGSAAWTLKQLARYQPVAAEGVQGALRSGLRASRLSWEAEGLKAQATDVQLAWQPLALLGGMVQLDHVRAATLRIEDRRPPKPKVVPVSLEIPVRVTLAEAKVDQLQWVAAGNSFEASELAGSYSFDGSQHQVKLDSLRWATGRYSGQASVGADGTLPVDAALSGRIETAVPGSTQKLPLAFTATLRGPMTDLQARALLEGQTASPSGTALATATARVTPWEAQPLPQAQAEFRRLDVGALWPQAPRTSLAGQVQLQPAGTATWALTTELTNEQPGPWDKQRLPVERLRASGEWRQSGQALVRSLQAGVAGGSIQATGQWRGADGWTMESRLEGVNPASVHSMMAPLAVAGRADLKGEGNAVAFDVDLKAQDVAARQTAPASSEFAAAVQALELRHAVTRGRWADGLLSLAVLEVRTTDAQLRASGELRPATRAGSGRAELQAPGLQVNAQGRLAERSGGGTVAATGANLAQALPWVARLPGVPEVLREIQAAGRAEANLAWQGGWRDPAVQASLAVPQLELRTGAAPPWSVRDAAVTINGRFSSASVEARGQAEQGQRRLTLDLAGQGGRRAQTPQVWQGQIATLKVSASDPAAGTGTWTLSLRRAFDIRWSDGSFDAAAGEALLTPPAHPQAGRASDPAVLAWEPVRWRSGELRTAGRLTGLPLAWLEIVAGPRLAGPALSGDMVFDAQWDASLGATPRLRASLARSRGDLMVLGEAAGGAAVRVNAEVREARLSLVGEGEAVTASLRWDSERAGTADGQLATRLARGGALGWHWPDDAPLSGKLRAQLPRIAVWSLLAPPGWRLRGSLGADVAVAGSRADPQLSGTLAADDLALRSVVDGIELQGGRLRARLAGRRLVVDEFLLRGPGPAGEGGTLMATGEGSWTAAGPQARMTVQVDRLKASNRSDRQFTVSGSMAAKHDASGTAMDGNLKVDQALIVLPENTTPKLDADVVVRNAAGPVTQAKARAPEQAAPAAPGKLALNVEIDLGDDFRVRGSGLDTRLRGNLTLSAQSLTAPRLVGTISATGGEYRAYGQRLDIERGVVRFTGPIDNPALDILAIRPNLVQRVGVEITGRAMAPLVRLYAEPDLPEAEKLSWLVVGRPSASGGAEAALLQQAGMALLSGRGGGSKRGIAAAVGLDELSFSREGADGPAVTLGKRFGRKFYAAYERSLSGAVGTFHIFYDITRWLTVRGETGDRTAVDLIFTFTFD